MIIIECQIACILLWSKSFQKSLNWELNLPLILSVWFFFTVALPFNMSAINYVSKWYFLKTKLSPPQINLIFIHMSEIFLGFSMHLYLLFRESATFILQTLNWAYKLSFTIFISPWLGSLLLSWLFHRYLNSLGPFQSQEFHCCHKYTYHSHIISVKIILHASAFCPSNNP